jgi:hypothetical protein
VSLAVTGNAMKQIALLSYAMTIAGVLLAAWSVAADLSPLWQLTGFLLIIAGVVKIAIVQIWQRIAGL